jgi:hypothetical protein
MKCFDGRQVRVLLMAASISSETARRPQANGSEGSKMCSSRCDTDTPILDTRLPRHLTVQRALFGERQASGRADGETTLALLGDSEAVAALIGFSIEPMPTEATGAPAG